MYSHCSFGLCPLSSHPTAPVLVESIIRLVNGSGPHEGRVEVFYDRRWGTVCDDGWDKKDGDVACRMLGFRGAEEVYRMARFGQGKKKRKGEAKLLLTFSSGPQDWLLKGERTPLCSPQS